MKFDIPNPCSEDWNKMKIGLNARHCDSCAKDVIDFTQQSREEILTYLLMHNGERVCVHIRRSQLDFSYNEIMFVIDGMTTKEKRSNLPFYILCMGALLLTSCDTGTTTGKIDTTQVKDTIVQTDSQHAADLVDVKDTIQRDTSSPVANPIKRKVSVAPPPPPPTGIIMTGEVVEGDIDIIEPEEVIDGNMEMKPDTVTPPQIFQFAEEMPEFPGGVNALMKFLSKNIQYPAFEKDQNIQGTVVAQFVVTKDGVIEDIKIVRSVKGAPSFNAEVIRVIKRMPKWKPGVQSGKNVAVKYNLPVRFRLT